MLTATTGQPGKHTVWQPASSLKPVAEASKNRPELLGSKSVNWAEMTRLKAPLHDHFSRNGLEAAFYSAVAEKGIFGLSPFETIGGEGIGELVAMAANPGGQGQPGLKLGACGEHPGHPQSAAFPDQVGLGYVSCAPFRVLLAWLEAGRKGGQDRPTGDGVGHVTIPGSRAVLQAVIV